MKQILIEAYINEKCLISDESLGHITFVHVGKVACFDAIHAGIVLRRDAVIAFNDEVYEQSRVK